MKELAFIFLGGGIGSVSRFLISRFIYQKTNSVFPFGTLTVNVLASLIAGLIAGLVIRQVNVNISTRLFIVVGFCGGLSTFSTFSVECIELLQGGSAMQGLAYILLSISLCLLSSYAGVAATCLK